MSFILNFESSSIMQSFIIYNKVIYILFLIIFFIDYSPYTEFISSIKKYFDIFFIINNTIIIFSFLFSIDYFLSYSLQYPRFGYKGLIPAANEVTGVYFFGLCLYFRDRIKFGNKQSFLFYSTILSALLTGTKGAWISVILISSYYLIKYHRKYLLFIIIPSFTSIIVFTGISSFIWKEYLSYFHWFIFKSDMNLFSVLISGRDRLIMETIDELTGNLPYINFIFGGADLSWIYTETDIVDLYLLLGIFILPLLFTIYKIFLINDQSIDNKIMFLFFLLLSAAGGHLLTSAIIPVYLLIYIFTYPNYMLCDRNNFQS